MHKRPLWALLAVLLLMLNGCAQPAQEPQSPSHPSFEPIFTPTPTPGGLKAAFGSDDLTVALITGGELGDDEDFMQSATRELSAMGITSEVILSDAVLNGDLAADAVIAYYPDGALADKLKTLAAQTPVIVYEADTHTNPGLSHLQYDDTAALDVLINQALTYPPHDTPVRLIGMFTAPDSELAARFDELFAQGKVLPRKAYYQSETESTPQDWFSGALEGYFEGMVDGVLAENAELALAAAQQLKAAGRYDMEVFYPGSAAPLYDEFRGNRDVPVIAVGPNDAAAGVLAARMALLQLKGESPQSEALSPIAMDLSTFEENYKDALLTPFAIASDLIDTYDRDWMQELREYYTE